MHSASANVVSGQDEFDLPAAWRELVERNGLDAVVCIAAAPPRRAERRGSRTLRPSRRQPWRTMGTVRTRPVARGGAKRGPPGLLRRRPMSQSLLIISRQSPWSAGPREALDIAPGGAFDLPVGMLVPRRRRVPAGSRPASAHLQQDRRPTCRPLPMFGVDDSTSRPAACASVAWRKSAWPSRSRCSTTRPCATCCNATTR